MLHDGEPCAVADALVALGPAGRHGALDPPEGCFVENTVLEIEGESRRGHEIKALVGELSEGGFCARYGGRGAVSRVVVALCEGPGPAGGDEDVRLFTGALEDRIAEQPRGPAGRGGDRLFVPEGYLRSFAELGASTYLVNMRHQPYLDLADHLRGRDFGGAFEAHVALRAHTLQLCVRANRTVPLDGDDTMHSV